MSNHANDNDCGDLDRDAPGGERQLQQLPFAAQLLVWGMRCWVTALKTGRHFADLSGDGFAQFGLGPAGKALDEMFQIIAIGASRQIDIRCVKCRNVSADESLLLDIAAAAQADSHHLAYAGLSELLPPAASRNAFPALMALAKFFDHAGLRLGTSGQGSAATARGEAQKRLGQLERDLQRGSRDMPVLIH